MPDLAETAKQTRAWACYDCGKCTATCPVARAGREFSPRRHVLATNLRQPQLALGNGSVFHCLTCGACDHRCPAQVAYTNLIRQLRELSRREGIEPECPHGGALQSAMRMMATSRAAQSRLNWLGGDLKTEPRQGEVFFWTGCTMYFDAFFTDLPVRTLAGTRAGVRLLNRLGITPVVSPDERCCGHDLIWNGEREPFEALARHNVGLVASSGAQVLVTSCAECLRTWRLDYAPVFPAKPPRMLHLSEFLLENEANLNLRTPPPEGRRKITYQDPCRLGRHLGIYEPPRRLLAALPGVELVEMRRSGPAAICCAGGTWSYCDRFTKRIQVDRLREARATGATVLATACPKCQIHLRCAMKDPTLAEDARIEVRDLAELVDEAAGTPPAAQGTSG